MKHILTINIEDYYQVDAFSELIPLHEWERFEDRIRRNTDSTLELLAETGSSATFFVSQWIAEKHGTLLRGITEAGHEVFLDDRDERAGVKFNDAELVGFPFIVTVGKKTIESGKLEVKLRRSGEKVELTEAELLEKLKTA